MSFQENYIDLKARQMGGMETDGGDSTKSGGSATTTKEETTITGELNNMDMNIEIDKYAKEIKEYGERENFILDTLHDPSPSRAPNFHEKDEHIGETHYETLRKISVKSLEEFSNINNFYNECKKHGLQYLFTKNVTSTAQLKIPNIPNIPKLTLSNVKFDSPDVNYSEITYTNQRNFWNMIWSKIDKTNDFLIWLHKKSNNDKNIVTLMLLKHAFLDLENILNISNEPKYQQIAKKNISYLCQPNSINQLTRIPLSFSIVTPFLLLCADIVENMSSVHSKIRYKVCTALRSAPQNTMILKKDILHQDPFSIDVNNSIIQAYFGQSRAIIYGLHPDSRPDENLQKLFNNGVGYILSLEPISLDSSLDSSFLDSSSLDSYLDSSSLESANDNKIIYRNKGNNLIEEWQTAFKTALNSIRSSKNIYEFNEYLRNIKYYCYLSNINYIDCGLPDGISRTQLLLYFFFNSSLIIGGDTKYLRFDQGGNPRTAPIDLPLLDASSRCLKNVFDDLDLGGLCFSMREEEIELKYSTKNKDIKTKRIMCAVATCYSKKDPDRKALQCMFNGIDQICNNQIEIFELLWTSLQSSSNIEEKKLFFQNYYKDTFKKYLLNDTNNCEVFIEESVIQFITNCISKNMNYKDIKENFLLIGNGFKSLGDYIAAAHGEKNGENHVTCNGDVLAQVNIAERQQLCLANLDDGYGLSIINVSEKRSQPNGIYKDYIPNTENCPVKSMLSFPTVINKNGIIHLYIPSTKYCGYEKYKETIMYAEFSNKTPSRMDSQSLSQSLSQNASAECTSYPESYTTIPLFWAVSKIYIDDVKQLLKESPDIIKDDKGYTAMHIAINTILNLNYSADEIDIDIEINKIVEIIHILLNNGENVNTMFSNNITALNIAVINDKEILVNLLLDRGANVNIMDTDGRTPLYNAVKNNNINIVNLLLDKGANINIIDTRNRTPLNIAVINDKEILVNLLLDRGANVNIMDTDGRTPLYNAVKNNNINIVNLLLDRGAKIIQSKKNIILIIIQYNYVGIFKILIDSRLLDKEISLDNNLDYLEYSRNLNKLYSEMLYEYTKYKDINEIIFLAIRNNKIKLWKKLLIECKIPINLQDIATGDTFLHIAVTLQNIKLIEYLVKLKISDIDNNRIRELEINYNGETAKDIAVKIIKDFDENENENSLNVLTEIRKIENSIKKRTEISSSDPNSNTEEPSSKKAKPEPEKKKYYKYKYKYLKAKGQKWNSFLNIFEGASAEKLDIYKNKLLNVSNTSNLKNYTNKYYKYKQKYLNLVSNKNI